MAFHPRLDPIPIDTFFHQCPALLNHQGSYLNGLLPYNEEDDDYDYLISINRVRTVYPFSRYKDPMERYLQVLFRKWSEQDELVAPAIKYYHRGGSLPPQEDE